jgi:tetratricopeptide (TPR) repeat protein
MNTNKILRGCILAGLFMLPFVPMIISESMFFPFITGKNFAFRIITEIIFALWVVLAMRDPQYRPKKSWILWAFGLFVIIIGVADLFGYNPYRSFWSNYERMEGFVTHLHLLALFVTMGSIINTEKLWKHLFHTSAGVAVFSAIYAFLQISGKLAIDQSGTRVDATFGNATYLAVFMMFQIFIALMYLLRKKDLQSPIYALGSVLLGHLLAAYYMVYMLAKTKATVGGALGLVCVSILVNIIIYFALRSRHSLSTNIFYIEIIILEAMTLYLTATRGAMIGLIGGIFLSALIYAVRAESGKFKNIAIGVSVAVLIFVGSFIAFRHSSFINSNPILGRFASISLDEVTTQSRFLIWKNISWHGFLEHPVLGWGQENFNLVFNKYYVPELWRQESWFDRSHNVFFDWLISAGLLGLLSYLALFGTAIYTIFKKKENTFSLADQCVLAGLFAGYFAQNLTVFDNITSYLVFFTVLAYLYSTQYKAEHHADAKKVGHDNSNKEYIVAAVTLIVFFVVFYQVNVRGILQSRTLIRAISPNPAGPSAQFAYFKKAIAYNSFGNSEAREQLVTFASNTARQQDVDQNLKTDIVKYAREEILKQVAQQPTDSRYRFFAGSFFNRIQDKQEAVEQLEKAVEYSPKKQMLLFELGSAYINNGQVPQALATFKKAYELDTNFNEARKIYAIGSIYAGDEKTASSLVSTEEMLSDDRFVSAYASRGQYDKVIAMWKARVAADPKNANYHVSLAAAYLGNKQRTLAVSELRKAIELNPQFKAQGEYYIAEIQAGRNP